MFYFETKLLDYKKFLQNRKLYMHEVHMKRVRTCNLSWSNLLGH